MDAGRFDTIARSLTTAASRRRLLQSLSLSAAATLLPRSLTARALDAGNEPTAVPVGSNAPTCESGSDCPPGQICVDRTCQLAGGTGGADAPPAGENATTTPAATTAAGGAEPTARAITTLEAGGADTGTVTASATEAPVTPAAIIDIAPDQALFAQIHSGICGELDTDPAFALLDVTLDGGSTETETSGQPTAIPARFSTSVVDANLADLLDSPYAVDIRLTADDPETSIACGDIGGVLGGQAAEGEIALGLAARNSSGYAGIAWLRDEGERMVVSTFVAPGLGGGTVADFAAVAAVVEARSPVSGIAAGTVVQLTEEVNLRSAPSAEASIVGLLPEGQELVVAAAPVDNWVAVRDPVTDIPGYISADYLTVVDE